MVINSKIPNLSVDEEEKWAYQFWKYLMASLWIVGFILITTIKITMFHSYMIFALYPILIAMFFLDRYGTMFVAGISVAIAMWFLENYYLMPWYFIIYGIASFIAYKYAYGDTPTKNMSSQMPHLIHQPKAKDEKNTIYVMYAMIIVALGSTLVDIFSLGKTIFILRFPIHIIEATVSGIAAMLTIMLYERIKKKRSERSPYKPI
ncbi:hypothetical protein GM182_04440 [bacterium 3DAC]|nr:hypothetical protein GM182_04440 [bacterium 3DAC]